MLRSPIRPALRVAAPRPPLRLPPPAWTLDFVRRPTFAAGPGRPAVSFARPSPGRYVASDGGETLFAADAPRRGDRGLLVEGARTNAFLNANAPASHTSPVLATGSHTLWVAGPGSVAVAANSATGSGFGMASDGSPVTFQITGAGTVDFTVTGGPTRAQCEDGAWATSFVDTAGSAVTRAADSVLIDGVDTAPWFDAAEGTLAVVAEFVAPAAALAGTAQFIAIFSDGSNANIVGGLNRNGVYDALNVILRQGGAEKVRINTATPPGPGRHAMATAWRSGDGALAVDGAPAVPTTNLAFTPPLITRLDIGRSPVNGGGNYLAGFIREISYWPRRVSNAELSVLSRRSF